MNDQDRAALAAAQDFSAGIAMWHAANAARQIPDFATAPRFAKRTMMPLAVAAVLAVVNFALLSFALLPVTASL